MHPCPEKVPPGNNSINRLKPMLANRLANEIYFRLNNVELLIDFEKKRKSFTWISVLVETWLLKSQKFRRGFHKNSRFKYFHNTDFHDFAATAGMSLLEIFPGLQSLRRKLLPRDSTSCRTKILLHFSKVQKIPVPNFKTCRFNISCTQKFHTSAHCRTSSDQPASRSQQIFHRNPSSPPPTAEKYEFAGEQRVEYKRMALASAGRNSHAVL